MKLGTIQKRVLELLKQGGKWSVYDICVKAYCSDPRGHISELRKKGVAIFDEWCESKHGRYKRYFLKRD